MRSHRERWAALRAASAVARRGQAREHLDTSLDEPLITSLRPEATAESRVDALGSIGAQGEGTW